MIVTRWRVEVELEGQVLGLVMPPRLWSFTAILDFIFQKGDRVGLHPFGD